MRRTFRLSLAALGAASALVVQAAPAQAGGTGVNACAQAGAGTNDGYSTQHVVRVFACTWDDNTYVYSTAAIHNNYGGGTSTFNVTAQLRRASDNVLIATQGCVETVSEGGYFYCTKAWPHSTTAVWTSAVVTRQPLSTQAVVYGPTYHP